MSKILMSSLPGQVVFAEYSNIEQSLVGRYNRLDWFEAGACPIRAVDVTAVVLTREAVPYEVVPYHVTLLPHPWARRPSYPNPGTFIPLSLPPVQPCRSAVRFGMGAG